VANYVLEKKAQQPSIELVFPAEEVVKEVVKEVVSETSETFSNERVIDAIEKACAVKRDEMEIVS
jgi:hypothetical protein